jgi:hypothetical protein
MTNAPVLVVLAIVLLAAVSFVGPLVDWVTRARHR